MSKARTPPCPDVSWRLGDNEETFGLGDGRRRWSVAGASHVVLAEQRGNRIGMGAFSKDTPFRSFRGRPLS